jgi:phage terminase large subunit-like protein
MPTAEGKGSRTEVGTEDPLMPIDAVTTRWIFNVSDERAAGNGCRFDEARGQHVIDWIEKNCCLFEGVPPGTRLTMADWQTEATLRLFGWVRWSEELKREIRRFTRAGIWLSKKNSKSVTLASWGVYLLCGDGESGQRVFSAARDGKQAKLSHRHAMEMIRMSPALSAACKVNESTGEITDTETRSKYQILAADNIKGQEGINGSVMIDECHVVDRRFANVVRYAGASREEPLMIEVSTAGNDPDGYGFEQYQFGKKVESGELDVQDFFFRSWEAPQDTTREQLQDRNELIRLGKLANPSWGRIVREHEFVASFEGAKDTGSKIDEFLMYRLGVWMRSGVKNWLNFDAWNKCRRDFTEDQLSRQTCYAGLDMASKKGSSGICVRSIE